MILRSILDGGRINLRWCQGASRMMINEGLGNYQCIITYILYCLYQPSALFYLQLHSLWDLNQIIKGLKQTKNLPMLKSLNKMWCDLLFCLWMYISTNNHAGGKMRSDWICGFHRYQNNVFFFGNRKKIYFS